MKRSIEKNLIDWRTKENRKPLLIRGARQIGKTYTIKEFGKKYFESILTLNFEEIKELKKSFENDLSPAQIIKDLSARMHHPIIAGKTLLFLDEIQACPNALMSLRFFKEQMPELHVIGAGSLLEFTLSDERFSFPVGRIESLYMRPLSFCEFLGAKNEHEAICWLQETTPDEPIGPTTHESLLRSVKEYFIVGGLPEAIALFLKEKQYTSVDVMHRTLLETYESDLGKYPKSSQQKFLKLLFDAAPRLVCENFKYAKIHAHAQSRDYLESLSALTKTGLLHQVFANAASGLPLEQQIYEKKFKLLFLDVGLLPQTILSILDVEDVIEVNRGKLAEQFVGQELVVYAQPHYRPHLYYWHREKKGAEAEVDYVIEVGPHIVPIEVKAGAEGSLRSLKQFLLEKRVPFGIRISQAPLSFKNDILSIPFYMIQQIPRLVQWVHDH